MRGLTTLLAAVFVSCVKILSAVRLNKDNKKISLKLPTNEVFIQTCYNNAAKDLYRDPYIYHETQNEHARNDKLYERFCVCIETSVKELIPVQQILQTYMSQTQEGQDLDLGEAEVGDSEDPDLIDGYEEETSEEPFDAEPPMELMEPMEPSNGTSNGTSWNLNGTSWNQNIHHSITNFELLIRSTTATAATAATTARRDEGVLFPDASETRAKKVGYY